jgi:hypothetical protein
VQRREVGEEWEERMKASEARREALEGMDLSDFA